MVHINDPLEQKVFDALTKAGIGFCHATAYRDGKYHLDFHLTARNVHVEVCAFHTPRKIRQLSEFDDVILLQGAGAVNAFVNMLLK